MSHIHRADTKPELILRSALFRRGFRFRVDYAKLKGRPDIVLPKHRAAIFVNGCFWHGHNNCVNFHYPSSNTAFWHHKIEHNIERDQNDYQQLLLQGWRICIVWECCLRGPRELKTLDAKVDRIEKWLKGSEKFFEIRSENTYRNYPDSLPAALEAAEKHTEYK